MAILPDDRGVGHRLTGEVDRGSRIDAVAQISGGWLRVLTREAPRLGGLDIQCVVFGVRVARRRTRVGGTNYSNRKRSIRFLVS